jgi:hypothetical protein
MTWQEGLADQLTKRRNPPALQYAILAVAGLVVAWGIAVCVVTTLAFLVAVFDL